VTARTAHLAIAAALALGLIAILVFAPRASATEPNGPRWQIVIQRPGEEWQPLSIKGRPPWLFVSSTGCALDLASQANVEPSGTRLACVRSNKP
jgi:hypothetical protein